MNYSYGKPKSFYERKQPSYSQCTESIYSIRDNVFTLTGQYVRLLRTVKQMSQDVKDISDMLQERNIIPRVEHKRNDTLPRNNSSKKQNKVLQDSSSSDQERRIRQVKIREHISRMANLLSEGPKDDGRNPGDAVAVDECPFDRREDIESEPE